MGFCCMYIYIYVNIHIYTHIDRPVDFCPRNVITRILTLENIRPKPMSFENNILYICSPGLMSLEYDYHDICPRKLYIENYI